MEIATTSPLAISPTDPTPEPLDEIYIRPRRGWIGVDWHELYRYRELLSYLVWRDVKVKYKQAMLGVAWGVILPLMSLAIYGGVAKAASFQDKLAGNPKPPIILWMFAGLVPWMFLQRAINDGGMSLVSNQALMTKIYLPRLYIPLSALGNALVDMAINVSLLIGLGLYFYITAGWTPSWQIVFCLPLLVLLAIAAMGLSFALSAATILYRDLRFLIPFFSQFGLWLGAVVYPLSLFPVKVQYAFAINPLTGIISGFRSAILGEPWRFLHLGSSIVLCSALLVFGLFYFKRVERLFADIA
jgi:lipopolysaccharide transport system permease protein